MLVSRCWTNEHGRSGWLLRGGKRSSDKYSTVWFGSWYQYQQVVPYYYCEKGKKRSKWREDDEAVIGWDRFSSMLFVRNLVDGLLRLFEGKMINYLVKMEIALSVHVCNK